MPRMMIRGGSAAEPERGFTSPFFHQGVKALEFRVKETYQMRILPAFDRNIDVGDPSFKLGFTPYRDANANPDALTKTEGFTDWYYVLMGYAFLGRLQKGFLSPVNTIEGKAPPGSDPIVDCRQFARKHENPSVKALIERPEGKQGHAVIPDLRRWAFLNTYLEREGGYENFIGYFSQMSLEDLKRKLSLRAGRNDEVISEDWPNYLFGDVTDPMRGLLATVKKGYPNDNTQKIESCVLSFSKKPGCLDGMAYLPIDPTTAEGSAILEARYDITDTDNVTKIATYQEILNYIVEDGTIPYWIIQDACSDYGSVPPEPASSREATYSLPPASEEAAEDAPAPLAKPAAKPAPAAARPVASAPRTATPAAARPAAKPAAAPARPAATAPAKPAAPVSRPAASRPAVPTSRPAPTPAKTHAALAPTPAAEPAGEVDEAAERAQYQELVGRLTEAPDSMSDEDFRTLSTLGAKYGSETTDTSEAPVEAEAVA